jgi:hypothetical protein
MYSALAEVALTAGGQRTAGRYRGGLLSRTRTRSINRRRTSGDSVGALGERGIGVQAVKTHYWFSAIKALRLALRFGRGNLVTQIDRLRIRSVQHFASQPTGLGQRQQIARIGQHLRPANRRLDR